MNFSGGISGKRGILSTKHGNSSTLRHRIRYHTVNYETCDGEV